MTRHETSGRRDHQPTTAAQVADLEVLARRHREPQQFKLHVVMRERDMPLSQLLFKQRYARHFRRPLSNGMKHVRLAQQASGVRPHDVTLSLFLFGKLSSVELHLLTKVADPGRQLDTTKRTHRLPFLHQCTGWSTPYRMCMKSKLPKPNDTKPDWLTTRKLITLKCCKERDTCPCLKVAYRRPQVSSSKESNCFKRCSGLF